MNKDLMMRAAVKFGGVWPDGATFLQVDRDEGIRVYSGRAGNHYESEQKAALLCTREQFEVFVESLFEGAPDDATHFRPNSPAKWYKISKINDDILVSFLIGDCKWGASMSHEKGNILIDDLIPRPVKKVAQVSPPYFNCRCVSVAVPQTPYIPKVGEECEVSLDGERWYKFVKTDKRNLLLDQHWGEMLEGLHLKFRPLRTERELFIEQAIEDYLDQVGSDAVDKKWFGRIFGAMYDAGYTKGEAK